MGCDGGSIPRRDEMVKLKKKAEKASNSMKVFNVHINWALFVRLGVRLNWLLSGSIVL